MVAFLFTNLISAPVDPEQKKKVKDDKEYRDDFNYEVQMLNYAFALIYQNFHEKIPAQKLLYYVLRGMASELDPFSHFEEPKDDKEVKIRLKGKYGGLGFIVSKKDGYIVVVSPFEDTPASEAGLEPGDLIVKIDDKVTHKMDINVAVKIMRGEEGTPITLTIKREGEKKLLIKKLIRRVIKLPSVKKHYYEELKIGYVRLIQFNEDSGKDTRKAFEEFKDKYGKEIKGIILDLRRNPGGYLTGAVEVASIFLKTGKLVVYTKGRIPAANSTYLVTKKPVFPKLPLVVIVDEGSASASEIVSGAIKDWKRGVLIGKKTFGKGSVQHIYNLPDKSAFYLTVAKYYTPKGICIDKKGIVPDIVVDFKRPKKEKKNEDNDSEADSSLESEIKSKLKKLDSDSKKGMKKDNKDEKKDLKKDKKKDVKKDVKKDEKKDNKEDDKDKKDLELKKSDKKKKTYEPILDSQLKSALDILQALNILKKDFDKVKETSNEK